MFTYDPSQMVVYGRIVQHKRPLGYTQRATHVWFRGIELAPAACPPGLKANQGQIFQVHGLVGLSGRWPTSI